MTNPQVTVITTTYNQGTFITDCIESVIHQTYTDWELIIVDDCSTDATEKIIQPYLQDRRISYLKHAKRWGIKRLHDSYNQAFKKSKGIYIATLEGDDYWPSHYLEYQVKTLANSSAVLSFANWVVIDGMNTYSYFGTYHYEKLLSQKKIMELFFRLQFYIIPAAVVIKRKVLEKIYGFQKGAYYPFTDIPTYYQLSLQGPFAYCSHTYAFYRKYPNSSWFSFAVQTNEMLRKEIQKECLHFMQKNSKQIQHLYPEVDQNEVNRIQKQYIAYKRQIKEKTLLFHYFVFRDNKRIQQIATQEKSALAMWLYILSSIPRIHYLLDLYIRIKIFYYILLRS